MQTIDWLKRGFAPPIFEDEKKTRLARHINSLAFYFIIPALIAGTINTLLSDNPVIALLLWAGLWFSLAAALVLVRWGYVRLAGWLCPTVGWVLLNITVILAGGELSPVFGGYLLTILATALIFGARVGIVYAFICLITVVGIAVGKYYDIFTPAQIQFSLGGNLAIYTLWIAGTAVLIACGTYILRTALEKIERTARFLRKSEAKFRKVVESSPGHVFLLDRQGQVLLPDPTGSHKALDADRTVSLYDGLYESDRSIFKDEIEKCFSKSVVRQFEIRGVDQAFIYQVWLSPVKGSDSTVDYITCNMYTHSPST